MTTTPESGRGSVMFEADGKFYIWNMLNVGIREVLTPGNLYTIINIMNTRGQRALMVRDLHR